MNKPIQDLRNLGDVMSRMLAEVDVFDEDDLRAVGSVEAYHRLKFRFGRRISLNALYAMDAALRNCDWRELGEADKERLRALLEGISKQPTKESDT